MFFRTSVQIVQALFCLREKMQSKEISQRSVHKYKNIKREKAYKYKYIYKFFKRLISSVFACCFSLKFNNKDFAHTKENFAGTCIQHPPI